MRACVCTCDKNTIKLITHLREKEGKRGMWSGNHPGEFAATQTHYE